MNRQTPNKANTRANAEASPASGLLQRACACGQHTGGSECEECSKKKSIPVLGDGLLQRRDACPGSPNVAPPIVHEVLRSSGQPLDTATRQFFEPRFGRDFSRVRVHTDSRAAESARSVNALAYTVGQNIVFDMGQYSPKAKNGQSLLAHELTHTVQQARLGAELLAGSLRVSQPNGADEREAETVAERIVAGSGEVASIGDIHPVSREIQRLGDLSKVPPGVEPDCEIAKDSPTSRGEIILFGNKVSGLSNLHRRQIDNFVVNWRAAGASAKVRVDGYASTKGPDDLNWTLSCDRAKAVVEELTTPTSGTPGIPSGLIRTIAQGETAEFGEEAQNRRAIISSSILDPPPLCNEPVSMNKVVSGAFRGGLSMDDYYPDLTGRGLYAHPGTAGPFDTGTQVGANVQLLGDIRIPCAPAPFSLAQTVKYTRAIFDGAHDPLEGVVQNDVAKSGRDFSRAPARQEFNGGAGRVISMADPPGAGYTGASNIEWDRDFVTSLTGPGGTKSVNWSTSIRVAAGTVTRNTIT